MPRKNIYIRKEDMPILEKAIEKFGEEKALGALMMEALEEKMNNFSKLKEEALKYQMLKQLDVPAFNEIINYKMKDYGDTIINITELGSLAAYLGNKDHFKTTQIKDWNMEWIDAFLWTGIDGLIKTEDFKEWYEEAKDNIEKGLEDLNNSEEDYEGVAEVEEVKKLKEEL